IHIPSLIPFAQILFADRPPAELRPHHLLHLRQRIQPHHQPLPFLTLPQSSVQFLPHGMRQSRNFPMSVSAHRSDLLGFSRIISPCLGDVATAHRVARLECLRKGPLPDLLFSPSFTPSSASLPPRSSPSDPKAFPAESNPRAP